MIANSTSSAGFTLIELALTIVIFGIIAITVVPKFANNSIFQARGFADQVISTLRYAQKSAIAQHRLVCVSLSSPTITLKIATSSAAVNCSVFADLSLPDRANNLLTAPAGITFTSPASINFDALGRTSTAASIVITDVATAITVEAETGYVHQ